MQTSPGKEQVPRQEKRWTDGVFAAHGGETKSCNQGKLRNGVYERLCRSYCFLLWSPVTYWFSLRLFLIFCLDFPSKQGNLKKKAREGLASESYRVFNLAELEEFFQGCTHSSNTCKWRSKALVWFFKPQKRGVSSCLPSKLLDSWKISIMDDWHDCIFLERLLR